MFGFNLLVRIACGNFRGRLHCLLCFYCEFIKISLYNFFFPSKPVVSFSLISYSILAAYLLSIVSSFIAALIKYSRLLFILILNTLFIHISFIIKWSIVIANPSVTELSPYLLY